MSHDSPGPHRPAIAGQLATGKRPIPDVPVVSHTGRNARFYSDLVENRVVVVQFMSIAHQQHYPVAENVADLASRLLAAFGPAVRLYSVTIDPTRDTVAELAKFARRFRVPSNWSLLTGEPEAVGALHRAFFVHGGATDGRAVVPEPAHEGDGPHDGGQAPDCSMGLLRRASVH